MIRQLIDYLPEVVAGRREMKAITDGQQTAVGGAWEAVEDAFLDQFVTEATIYGVRRWEAMLGIVPRAGEALEERRLAILARLNENLPYTIRALRQQLDTLCGAENYRLEMQPGGYVLSIHYAERAAEFVAVATSSIERMAPANIHIDQYVIIDAAIFHNPNALRLPHLELELTIPNFADCVTLDGRYLLNGSWPLNQTRRGTLSLDALAVETSAVNREVLGGTLVRDNLFCLDGSWTLDGSKNLDAYYTEEEI